MATRKPVIEEDTMTVAVERKDESYKGPRVRIFLPKLEDSGDAGITVDQYEHVTLSNEVKEENFTAEPSPSETERIIRLEGENIIRELKGYVICFAVEGKKISSEGLAEKFLALKASGISEISFVIGGSYGISAEIKRNANELISMSDMTFPHTLARVMAAEQIYRAFTISAGGKYHK